MPDTTHHIRDLAYRLWEEEGRPHGREAEHWLDAERRFQSEQPPAETAAPVKKAKKAPARASGATPKRTKPASKSIAQPTP